MWKQSLLVSFEHVGYIYPGQVSGYYPSSRTVYVWCIAPLSKHHGKEYIRFQDEVREVMTSEEFLLLGIDRNTKLPYAIRDAKQLAELDKVEQIARATDFETLQAARRERFWQSREDERKRIERAERQKRKQAMIFKRSDIPVAVVGKAPTTSIAVSDNGQLRFSSLAAKPFEGKSFVTIGWEEDGERVMSFAIGNPATLAKGTKPEDVFFEMLTTKKGSQRYINASGILKHEGVGYDYKNSGTHTFPATIVDVKNGAKVVGQKVTFELPVSMEKRPVTTRKPRKAKNVPNGQAPVPQVQGTGDGGLQLEVAN